MRQQDARHAYRCSICMEIANSSMDGKILIYVQFSKNKVFPSSVWRKKLPFYNDAQSYMLDGVNGKHDFYPSSLGTSPTKSKSLMIFDGSTTVKTAVNYHIESLHETPYIVLLQVEVNNPH